MEIEHHTLGLVKRPNDISFLRANQSQKKKKKKKKKKKINKITKVSDYNEQPLKEVMNAKVDGRSARGRPRFGWTDGVKTVLNDRRTDVREASERARDKNEWQMIVTQF